MYALSEQCWLPSNRFNQKKHSLQLGKKVICAPKTTMVTPGLLQTGEKNARRTTIMAQTMHTLFLFCYPLVI